MAIQDDFTIYPYSKTIRHTSGTTVYSAVAFYSYLMDTFDEPGFLTYETPIRFNTPTSFTMLNGWFLDNGDGSNILQYLTGGAIDTTGYGTISDPIRVLDVDDDASTYAAFVSGDKDLTVQDDASNIGPLLAYKNNYAGTNTARLWIRDTNSNGVIADNSAITVSGGTGVADAAAASIAGDEIYANLFTIADFPGSPNPQVYVYQTHPVTGARTRIAEWSAFSNWDRGSIDILISVQEGGALIDSGQVSTFVRQTGDTFTFVESTLSNTRTPIATETAADEVNIAEGEHYLLVDGGTDISADFSVGDVISDVDLSAGVPPTWYAEVVSVTEFGDATTGVLELRGLRGTITDNDNIYVSNVIEAVANGTPGDTYISYSAGTDPTTLGQVMTGGTSGAKRLLRGVDATANKLVCQDDPTGVTGTARDDYYKDFSSGETVTGASDGSVTTDAVSNTLISGFNDITIAHINGTVATGSFSNTPILGERVTWNAGASEAIVVDYVADTSLTLANVDPTDEPTTSDVFVGDLSGTIATASAGLVDANTEDYNFTLQSAFNYSVFIEGGSIYNTGRSLTDIYAYLQYYVRDGVQYDSTANLPADGGIYTSDGSSITILDAEEYIKADASYAATKPAPFGTLAGGVFFGAQAVWIQGMRTADNNNIKLLDATGTLREPFTSVDLTITNTRVDDRIAVYLEDGSTTLPNKAQYTSHATNNIQSGSTFDVDAAFGAFPNDTPTSGAFIVVDTSANEEHRYRYVSFNATGGSGDDGQLVLPTERTGTADGATSGQTLEDLSATFVTWGIQVGDIIRRTNGAGGWAYVTEVVDEDTLTTTLLSAGSGWATSDTFEINSLVATYDGSDTFFIPYMDTIEDTGTDGAPGSQTVSLTYVSDRDVVLVARNVENTNYEIVPFKTTGTITSTGLSLSIIRTTDTVYTP